MRSAWLIYNPGAGRFPAGPFLHRASQVLARENWEVRTVEGKDGEDLTQLSLQAVEQECSAVFVAGGDGSVGTVASALAGSDTALGVLPSGTANVWAQELGLPRLDWIHWFALEQAAAQLAKGDVRLVDLGICNERAFLLWGGMGLDAHIVNSIEPRERWEKAFPTVHYATLALWNSIGWEGIDIRVVTPETELKGRYLVAVACNIPAYAGGLMNLAPGAKIDDGLLDFWLIEGKSVKDVLLRVFQIFRGTHVDAPGVTHFRTPEAYFEAKTPVPMQFDGEPLIVEGELQFSVRKQALKVLVPVDTGPHLFTPETNS
jgi:diacylglycerol kinase (ATP)